MIDFNFSQECCGCGACADACALGCIAIIKDKHDFRIPQVNADKCVNCGKCDKVCPVLNVARKKNDAQKLICTYNNDEEKRMQGSSGSVFYEIAKETINQGGVVFGAAFVEKLQLKHIKVEKIEDIYPLMKSKYIQSNTNGVFQQVKDELKKGRKVCFVGTPCHCQALYNFLGKKTNDNLILIDFICHGVPSQSLFDKAIAQFEKDNDCDVTGFSFRRKTGNSLRNYEISYIDKSGNHNNQIGCARKFHYYCGYLKYFTFRDSCYQCKFVGHDRITDMTLGDFWGLEKIEPQLNDINKGYSMLIVNSNKGAELFKKLSGNFTSKEYPLELAARNNYAYCKPAFKSKVHNWFLHDYTRLPYDKLAKRYFFWKEDKLRWILRCLIKKLKI